MEKEGGEGTVRERDGGEGCVMKRNEKSGSGEGGNLKQEGEGESAQIYHTEK